MCGWPGRCAWNCKLCLKKFFDVNAKNGVVMAFLVGILISFTGANLFLLFIFFLCNCRQNYLGISGGDCVCVFVCVCV